MFVSRILLVVSLVAFGASVGETAPRRAVRPLVVRDSVGAFVGVVTGPTAGHLSFFEGFTPVTRRIGNTVVDFMVNARGTAYSAPVAPLVAFESDDCSGPQLVRVGPDAMSVAAFFAIDITESLHYPILPGSLRIWHSTAFYPAGMPCEGTLLVDSGWCCLKKTSPEPRTLADIGTLDLSAMGLVAPFHIDAP
jgi:hypothetical protein